MREIVIGENEAGQRLDKFLAKYMKKAPKSFFYKMLRKKNIVLNGKKASGNEKAYTRSGHRGNCHGKGFDAYYRGHDRVTRNDNWCCNRRER